MRLRPGDAFGRYQLDEFLGCGAMGEVYSAHDTVLHRKVALKVLTVQGSSFGEGLHETDGAGRILREARAAAGITHPNAVAIYDVGEVDSVSFLAMELVTGRTLRSFIGDGSIPVARRIRWVADVARALGAAHQLGLIHRDVKPENVMLRDDGLVKVLDFGISRRTFAGGEGAEETGPAPARPMGDAALAELARTNGTLTADGHVVGTPMYMAPEQMLGRALDGRADQFAWGVLAHEVLTGKLPWDGEGLAMLSQILETEVKPLTDASPGIPAPVDAVIRKALSKEPGERSRTMEEIADVLEPFSASTGGTTGRPERWVAPTDDLQIITWSDIFVLVDYGLARPTDYVAVGEQVRAEAAKYPGGLGALTVIPRDVTPPAHDARVAMHDVMQKLGSSLRCFCWLIEADGFQGAMVRGVLTGMRMFGRLPYETHVSTDAAEALGWLLLRLDGSERRLPLIPDGVRWIAEQRRDPKGRPPRRG